MARKGDVRIVPRKKGAGNGIKLIDTTAQKHGRLATGDDVDIVSGPSSRFACKARKIGWGEVCHGEAFQLVQTNPAARGGPCSLVTKDSSAASPPAATIPVDHLGASPPAALTWAQLTGATFFLELPNWPIWLKSSHKLQLAAGNPRDQYLVAECGGGREVRADRDVPALWETFTLIRLTQRSDDSLSSGDLVCLQAANGQYLTAEGGGGREVAANRGRPGDWETFIIEEVGSGTIRSGDQIRLRTPDGKYYMTAEMGPNGGGDVVNMNRTEAAAWETFTIEFPDPAQFPSP